MIPRLIHHVWVGPPMPERLRPYVASWQALHLGWEHVMWGAEDLRWMDNWSLFDAADTITPHHGQLRADLARYEILHAFGGVYVDCDMEALRPIDALLDTECFAGWETDGQWVNNAVLGCEPGHPLMVDLIAAAPASIEANRQHRPNRMTGPHLLTPLALDHGITVHPSTAFYPYRWDQLDRQGGDYGDAYAVHHWDNARKRKGLT